MALRGNLKDFSLPDVFQLVTFSKKTGVLRISRSDGGSGSVWFRDGEVFFAQSNWHHELLGERLVAAQKITPSALAKALEIRAAEGGRGRRLGQVLIEEGYITDRVLEAFVQEQIQDTIFDLMRWDEGDFDFELLPEAVDEDIGLSVSIENVIMEGSRRLEEWARIKKRIPSMDIVFKMATAPGEGTFEISLKPVEWNLLLLVDGTRSVAELARETNRTDFEVARIMYGLFSAGLLEFASDEEVARLREERAEREAKAEQIRAEEPTTRTEPEPERAPEAEPALAQESKSAPVPEVEPEMPEFLSGGRGEEPTPEDMAVFDQMMGAVLDAPRPEPMPEIEPQPQPEPEPVQPEPEPVQPEPEPKTPLTGDLERDLISLGLGEPPGEEALSATEPEPEPEAPLMEESPDSTLLEPESPPAGMPEQDHSVELESAEALSEPEARQEPEAAGAGLGDLLDSLEEPSDEVIRSESFGETQQEPANGVISTDAFLDFDKEEIGSTLSTGLTDEISALTGAQRSRPQASVKKIPEAGEPVEIRRDQAVGKDLVLKIIDGIKRL